MRYIGWVMKNMKILREIQRGIGAARPMESNLRQALKPNTIRLLLLWGISTVVAVLLISRAPEWAVENLFHILLVWVLFIISAVCALLLLYLSSKSIKVVKRSLQYILIVIAYVTGSHALSVMWFGPSTPLSFVVINPQPMAWLLLSVVTIYVSAVLASIGFPYISLNRMLARRGRPPLGRQISHSSVADFPVNLWESGLACFWIVYLWGIYNQATGHLFVQDWDLWAGWPFVPVSLALLFCISFLAFADILGISYARAIISVRRYSRNWTLSVPALLGFVVTMYALLKGNPHEYLAFLWLAIALTPAPSLGFSLSLMALREWVFRRAHCSHWYYSLQLDQ